MNRRGSREWKKGRSREWKKGKVQRRQRCGARTSQNKRNRRRNYEQNFNLKKENQVTRWKNTNTGRKKCTRTRNKIRDGRGGGDDGEKKSKDRESTIWNRDMHQGRNREWKSQE